MDYLEATPDEIVDLYRSGEKRGFIAGVVFCVTLKYLYDRRKKFADDILNDDIRRRN